MEAIPDAFIDELVMSSSWISGFSRRALKLSDPYSSLTETYLKHCHKKTFYLENGDLGRISYVDLKATELQPQNVRSQYRKFTALEYDVFNSAVPQVADAIFDKFVLEKGVFSLILCSSQINDNWVKQFSSWQKLVSVSIETKVNETVTKLLDKLLNQKQILDLSFSICGDQEIKWGCEFLQQDQFRCLSIAVHQNVLEERILDLWESEKTTLSGKTVAWWSRVMLHDESFQKVNGVKEERRRYEARDRVVEYINRHGKPEMTEEEFMEGVNVSSLRFL
ncbi:hypothetical protein L596_017721 [Steinernema carpocapsae]|uniref:Uncharacterized protein n=1 Tax=Steinernema carpocapsae TaxID=34508 RepID=A0A4U5N2G8_STECR|nr:hypothetical protein L596_017721 [Steinernema carpocapsae]